MADRKYTRKQLRQPDEFISISMKIWEAITSHAPRVIVTAVVAVVIVAGVWTWSYFADANASRSTGVLSRGVDIYNQSVDPATTRPASQDDDIPRFKTHKARLEASEKEFTRAVDSSRGSLRSASVLLRAGVRFELEKYDLALKDYRTYLKTGGHEALKLNAMEGVGYCLEGKKQWDEALEAFRKLPREGDGKWLMQYHEGRLMARKGQKKEATKLLREVVSGSKSRRLQDRAAGQLAEIELTR